MRFIDEVTVQVIAGDGGRGAVSWRREKYVPRGGPDGGDGGSGGAVVFVSDPGSTTLMECALNPIMRAEAGEDGSSNQKTGKNGADFFRSLPVGTQVHFDQCVVADLDQPGAHWVAARGGRGGKGNAFFKSSTNRAPQRAQPGRVGERHELRLVLKSVADIGLVGLPNVGKSSLVGALTEAHPLVADYPFTTLTPTLGVVETKAQQRFVMADIPGLIEGAHTGKGLGIQFLKHVERTSVLAHVIDVTQEPNLQAMQSTGQSPTASQLRSIAVSQFELLEHELRSFNEDLLNRPRVALFTKVDLELQQEAMTASKDYFAERTLEVLSVSSHSGQGLDRCKEQLFQILQTPTNTP